MLRFKQNKWNNVTVAIVTVMALFFTPFESISAEEYPQTHVIAIEDLKFMPQEINVKPGDIVQWVNFDFIPHTATANDHVWNSDMIGAQASWEMTVDRDTFEGYFCVYHPGMQGKIKIITESLAKAQQLQ
ncbi:MAG: hypothetical protein K0U40_08450 [Betaproteobacteria bacterium]|nr:hypothetical protein [Betaproteobacteria bacterium]